MITVLVITPGSTEILIHRLERLDLPTTRGLVGGDIEHVTLARDLGMYVNEEGRMLGQEHNLVASRLYWAARHMTPSDVWDVRGPAVLVGPPTEDGDDTSCPDHVIKMLGNVPGLTLREANA